jgi:hypothetical protein
MRRVPSSSDLRLAAHRDVQQVRTRAPVLQQQQQQQQQTTAPCKFQ